MKISKSNLLYQIALEQQGLFTSKQARKAGFDDRNHRHYIEMGHWEREIRGIYRLKQFPYEDTSEYALWSLWSCNRREEPQGVFSHETALAIYDLTDLNPAKITMTVPPSFRRNAQIPKILVLRKGKLEPTDWQLVDCYKVTTPIRTLRDVILADHIPDEFVHQALAESTKSGLCPNSKLKKYGILDLMDKYR